LKIGSFRTFYETINIKNTRLQAITDKEGKYSIEYIPGTFSVLYSKPDYTSHEIRLSLTSKEKFPARKVTLCTLPKLYIKTAPEKADIKIIGIKSKYYEGLNLEPGTYSLEVSADGYTTKRQKVSLMPGANKKLYVQLDLVAPFPIKKSVNARFIDNSISGQIFVISGKVKNELSKQTRKLFLIGYGFGDKHINEVFVDSVKKCGLKLFVISPSDQSKFISNLNSREYGDILIDALAGYFPYTLLDIFPKDQSESHAWKEIFSTYFAN
jgi:hypothetical protein